MATRVHRDCDELIARMHAVTGRPHGTVRAGVAILSAVRQECYEHLNQVQHEYLALEAAEWLVENGVVPQAAAWQWNPRQSGGADEPDLQAMIEGVAVLSAEVTTSLKPAGTIDKHMASTLKKFKKMPGPRYYFVRSEAMAQRARTKAAKGTWDLKVVCLTASELTGDQVAAATGS